MLAIPHGTPARVAILLALALALAGCDKCGNRVNPSVPSLQQSCGDNVQAPR